MTGTRAAPDWWQSSFEADCLPVWSELVRLVERAGLVFEGAHAGCTCEPFRASGPEVGGRVGLVGRRP